jgi:hypothetical protein
MCDSGRAGGGGKACEKPPRSRRRRSVLYPRTTPSEIIVAPPSVPSRPFTFGDWEEEVPKPQTVFEWRSSLRARGFLMSHVLRHTPYRVVAVRTLLRWLLGSRLYEQCAVAITLGTMVEAAYR